MIQDVATFCNESELKAWSPQATANVVAISTVSH